MKKYNLITLSILTLVLVFAFSASSPKPEREFFGFIRNINGQKIEVDEVEFLSGEEAIQKGMQDTGCPREKISDCIPSMNNDFYIRNLDKTTQNFVLNSGAKISILPNPGSPALEQTDIQGLGKAFSSSNAYFHSPFKFKAKGQNISEAEQQYIP